LVITGKKRENQAKGGMGSFGERKPRVGKAWGISNGPATKELGEKKKTQKGST